MEERYVQRNVPTGYCKKCGKWLGPQEGNVRIIRLYEIDENFRRTGKLTERPDCPDGAHEEGVGDSIGYQGLHLLQNGHHLTIYRRGKPLRFVWSGIIELVEYPADAVHKPGFLIQSGVDPQEWKRWFDERYPATLTIVE
ncbi:hypothetical protein HZC00_05140 [Candidatus Kaiserbacteria bacterium]|nr:hypothetical protein [Candidatus Kaiserbacteria bacterium]